MAEGTTLTLTRQRVSERNGMAAYKADTQRTTGTVYFDKKMFPNGAPDSVEITAVGLAVPQPKAAPAPAAATANVAEAGAPVGG
jgi:hypothetical protein